MHGRMEGKIGNMPAWRSYIACALLCAGVSAPVIGATTLFRLSIPDIPPEPIVGHAFFHGVTNSPGLAGARHGVVTVLKGVDQWSVGLVSRICSMDVLSSVLLESRTQEAEYVQFLRIKLHDVLVSSYQVSGESGKPLPVESVSFNYGRIEWTYIRTDTTGVTEHAGSTYWDHDASGGGVHDPDSDGDGIPDSYEAYHRLKAMQNDANDDLDDDGMTNVDEYRAGTSASDSNSVFKVSGISTPTAAGFTIKVTFESIPGRIYDLYGVSELGGVPVHVETLTASSNETTTELNLAGDLAFVLVFVRTE